MTSTRVVFEFGIRQEGLHQISRCFTRNSIGPAHGNPVPLSPPFPRELINNQVQQIQTLTDQLNEFKHYESLFSDPKAVLLTTVQPLVNDLRKTELGQRLTTLDAGRGHALQRQGAVHEHRHDVHHSKWTNGHAIGSAISAGRRSSERLQILLHGGIEGFAENQAATALCRWESPFA